MNKSKKNARPDGDASEQAKQENHHTSGNFHNYCITHSGTIASLLLEGQGNAIPRRELERITGLDGRKIRLLIEAERRSGTPILSDCSHGYFLPADDVERAACVRSLRHRARQIMSTARYIEGRKNTDLEGQIVLHID